MEGSSQRDSWPDESEDIGFHEKDSEDPSLLDHMMEIGDFLKPYIKLTSTEKNRRSLDSDTTDMDDSVGSATAHQQSGTGGTGDRVPESIYSDLDSLTRLSESQQHLSPGLSSSSQELRPQRSNSVNTKAMGGYAKDLANSALRSSLKYGAKSIRNRYGAVPPVADRSNEKRASEETERSSGRVSMESSESDLSGGGELAVKDHSDSRPGDAVRVRQPKTQSTTPDIDAARYRKKFRTREEQIRHQRELRAELVGWHQIGGWDSPSHSNSSKDNSDLLHRRTFLDDYISDRFLGDWYQNTILIVVSTAAGWFLGHLGMGISYISIVLAFTATAYRSSMRRVRRNCRDDLMRAQALRRIEKESETMEWLNSFMTKFWLIYEPSLSMTIAQVTNELLEEQKPGFIDQIQLDHFTLGSKAPRIDLIRSFPKTDPQEVVIDMAASFTPNDTSDLTARQLQEKVNPKVKLGIRLGKGFLKKKFPILLEDMSFKGKMRFRINMINTFPHIKTIEMCFLDPPDFDFVLKPIGGEKFGFDIKIIPGLSEFIKQVVDTNLGPMVYSPNTFQLNVQQLIAGVGVLSGVGVVGINIKAAYDLLPDSGGTVEAYVRLVNKDKKELARSRVKKDSRNPVWEEYLYAIVTSLNEVFHLEVCNFQEGALNYAIGSTSFSVDNVPADMTKEVIYNGGSPKGELEYMARFSEIQMPQGDDQVQARRSRDMKSGILHLTVVGARQLDTKSSRVAHLSPFCDIELDGKLIDSTKTTSGTDSPEWNHSAEYIVHNKAASKITFRVRNGRSRFSSTIGLFRTRLVDLLASNERGIDYFNLSDSTGQIFLQTQWKPVSILGTDSESYLEPIGVVRLAISSAVDLPEKGRIIGPYCRVSIGQEEVYRTPHGSNARNPVWDGIKYLPVQSETQTMTFEVMNSRKHGKHLTIGSFQVRLSSIVHKDSLGNYKLFSANRKFASKFYSPGGACQGLLWYTMDFFPCIRVISPSEKEHKLQEKAKIDEIRKVAIENEGLSESLKEELKLREERLDLATVDLSLEKQLQYHSGIFAFSILSAKNIDDGMRLVIFANNLPAPIFSSPPAQRTKLSIEGSTGDFVSRQINLSSIRLVISENSDGSDPQYERTLGCFELMRAAFDFPCVFDLGRPSIELQARLFPLPELHTDNLGDISRTGSIIVELLGAVNLPSADRSGLSDPYVRFYLAGDRDCMYMSDVEKNTLNPVFNEKFRFDVGDVASSTLKVFVYDWDLGSRDDLLGGYIFKLEDLTPLVWKEYEVELHHVKSKRDIFNSRKSGGVLKLRMKFAPGYLNSDHGTKLVGSKSVSRVAGGARRTVPAHMHLTEHADTETFVVSVMKMSVTNINSCPKEVQIRTYLITHSEKEVFRSKTLKIEEACESIKEDFEVVANEGHFLGVKVVSVNAFGRHKDIGQAAVKLVPGEQKAELGKDLSVLLTVTRAEPA